MLSKNILCSKKLFYTLWFWLNAMTALYKGLWWNNSLHRPNFKLTLSFVLSFCLRVIFPTWLTQKKSKMSNYVNKIAQRWRFTLKFATLKFYFLFTYNIVLENVVWFVKLSKLLNWCPPPLKLPNKSDVFFTLISFMKPFRL